MKVLVIDVGGTNIKVSTGGPDDPLKIPRARSMNAARDGGGGQEGHRGLAHTTPSPSAIPGPVANGRPAVEPKNLGAGWVRFDYDKAFGKPVRVVNDAAMQALGSYQGGRMLFLGLGTGLGSAFVANGQLEPLELAHLPYRNNRTYEDYVGLRGFKRIGPPEVAAPRREGHRAAQARPAGRLRDAGRRPDQEAQGPASRRARRQQLARDPGRDPALGDDDLRGHQPCDRAAAARRRRRQGRRRRRPEARRHVHPPLSVRHGATQLTAEDRFAGAVGVDLSDEGRWQVGRLAERLAHESIRAVYCSPLGPHGGDGGDPGQAASPGGRSGATACARSATAAGRA